MGAGIRNKETLFERYSRESVYSMGIVVKDAGLRRPWHVGGSGTMPGKHTYTHTPTHKI